MAEAGFEIAFDPPADGKLNASFTLLLFKLNLVR